MSESTRVDKFLWSVRVFKTRADATEACKGGKVTVNDIMAKPSKEVRAGDILSVRKSAVHYVYKVVMPIDKRQGAKNVDQFVQNLTPVDELDKLHAPVETFFVKRDRGTGRPTKKDRREMDGLYSSFFDDEEEV